jgi:hypothetical protein
MTKSAFSFSVGEQRIVTYFVETLSFTSLLFYDHLHQYVKSLTHQYGSKERDLHRGLISGTPPPGALSDESLTRLDLLTDIARDFALLGWRAPE